MKKNATPELSAKWWDSNAPDGLDGKDLTKALGDYETAYASLEGRPGKQPQRLYQGSS